MRETAAVRVAQGALGGAAIGLGGYLALRPLTSLAALVVLLAVAMLLTGVGELLEARREARGSGAWDRAGLLAAAVWVLLAVAVLAWPGATVRVVAALVAVAMVVAGASRIWAAVLGIRRDRVAAVLTGTASVVVGALALGWPDVTVLVVAVLFGVRTAMLGVSLVWGALRGRRAEEQAPDVRAQPRHPVLGALRGAVALLVALALAAVSLAVHRGHPEPDSFYAAPDGTPAGVLRHPGRLLRAEPFTRGVPADAVAWRILYTTTRAEGVPALASGIVMVARDAASSPRPVVAWAHGTTGYAEGCAPTLLEDPLGAGAAPAVPQLLGEGWALVATDYVGLGTKGPHPYLIGQGEARSVLDAVRAARRLAGRSDGAPRLSRQTVVWGHSQGGNAALWTGQIASAYAPDVPLAGVAALAPASDLRRLAGNLATVPGGAIFASYIVAAYAATYDDVRFGRVVRGGAQSVVREASRRCLAEPGVLVSIATTLGLDKSIFAGDPTTGAFGRRLAQNTPTGPIAAPLLIGQGGTDALVLPAVQRAYAAGLCGSGQRLDYRVYPGFDHVGVVGADSPLTGQLVAWTRARFADRPARDTCARLAR